MEQVLARAPWTLADATTTTRQRFGVRSCASLFGFLLALQSACSISALGVDGVSDGAPVSDAGGPDGPKLQPMPFARVFAGDRRSCGVREDGRAVCWGLFGSGRACEYEGDGLKCWNFGVSDPPREEDTAPPTDGLVEIELKHGAACGLRGDHTLTCWVDPSERLNEKGMDRRYVDFASSWCVVYGLTHMGVIEMVSLHESKGCTHSLPAGKFKTVATAVGDGSGAFACALRLDDTVECWGNAPNGIGGPIPMLEPEGRFVQLSEAFTRMCGLRVDGSVECWAGENIDEQWWSLQCDDHACGLFERHTGPFVQVAAGGLHTCGLRDDGEIECWGAGTYEGDCWPEDLDVKSRFDCGQAMPPPGPFTEIAAGLFHTCGLHPDGQIECWGAGKTRGDCPDERYPLELRGECGESLAPKVPLE